MPTLDEYIRLRQMGSAQQEFGRMQSSQGAFIEALANKLVSKSTDEEPKDKEESEEKVQKNPTKKSLPKNIKQAMVLILKKKGQASGETARSVNRDTVGVPTESFKHSIKPY